MSLLKAHTFPVKVRPCSFEWNTKPNSAYLSIPSAQ